MMWWEIFLENHKFILMVVHYTNNSDNGGIYFSKAAILFSREIYEKFVAEYS